MKKKKKKKMMMMMMMMMMTMTTAMRSCEGIFIRPFGLPLNIQCAKYGGNPGISGSSTASHPQALKAKEIFGEKPPGLIQHGLAVQVIRGFLIRGPRVGARGLEPSQRASGKTGQQGKHREKNKGFSLRGTLKFWRRKEKRTKKQGKSENEKSKEQKKARIGGSGQLSVNCLLIVWKLSAHCLLMAGLSPRNGLLMNC